MGRSEKQLAAARKWREEHRPEVAAYNATYREDHRERTRIRDNANYADHGWRARLRHSHNIEIEDYEALLAEQGGRCAICRRLPAEVVRGKRLAVDHDHACCPGSRSCGKCIRGLICTPCNLILGYANDDPLVLAEAIVYLERSR